MSTPSSFEARLKSVAVADGRYPVDAYRFVYEGLDFTLKRIGCKRHITGRELLEAIRDLALEQFGGMALLVFEMWGVRKTSDFGNLVFNLVDAGLMSRSESDSREDFEDVYDFKEVFRFNARAGPVSRPRQA
jgi:uncharacterized repeat protein (TIGR04138 family)